MEVDSIVRANVPPAVITAPRKKKKYRLINQTFGVTRVFCISLFASCSREEGVVAALGIDRFIVIHSRNATQTRTRLITPSPNGAV